MDILNRLKGNIDMNIKNIIRTILFKSNAIKRFRLWQVDVFPYIKMKWLNPKAVFLVNTPIHGNLGDHAIAKSETILLDSLNIKYIELSGYDLNILKYYNKLNIMNKRTILINGGGNLGTLWFNEEQTFRMIMQLNKKSKIIIFPSTIYYAPSEIIELEKSRVIYNAHPNLTICARERISYEFMKDIYNNVVLIPDMVLFFKQLDKRQKRQGCLICLRKDKERTLTNEIENNLTNILKNIFANNIKITNTVVNRQIPFNDRDKELEKKFNEFMSAELIITDRLHGMIFSAITCTPCIVFNSLSPKLKGCYEWIKSLEYIKFCDNVDEIPELITSLVGKEYNYNIEQLDDYYNKLKKIILLNI